VERSWGVLGEGAGRGLIITVGTMAPGFFKGEIIYRAPPPPPPQSGYYSYAREYNISTTLIV